MTWTPKFMLIQPTKTSKWAEVEKWDWKAPFRELTHTKIKEGNDNALLLEIDDRDYKDLLELCDGRFKVEILMEEMKEEDNKVV